MVVLDAGRPRLLPLASGGSLRLVPVPLRRDDESSPWCYAASLAPIIPLDDDGDGRDAEASAPLPPGANFLATQVWPSSRIASTVVERCMDPSWTVCELGCGPGLPSLTAAKCGARSVVATDVDELALEMVRAAAVDQGFVTSCNTDDDEGGGPRFVTKQFDLTSQDDNLPEADLYILSDVFESAAVAEGAAWHVQSLLSKNPRATIGENVENGRDDISRVWVFAQSDRAQRDSFLAKMRDWCEQCGCMPQHLDWTMDHAPDREKELWLFDLDETLVGYN